MGCSGRLGEASGCRVAAGVGYLGLRVRQLGSKRVAMSFRFYVVFVVWVICAASLASLARWHAGQSVVFELAHIEPQATGDESEEGVVVDAAVPIPPITQRRTSIRSLEDLKGRLVGTVMRGSSPAGPQYHNASNGSYEGPPLVGGVTSSREGELECPPEGIVALTYASHHGRDDRFCRSLESAIRNGVPLHVLGWQVKWEGLVQKLKGSLQAVEKLRPDCIVTFNDAFDLLYAADLRSIKRQFLETGARVLFSAECGCWPQILRGRRACFEDYPTAPTPYRYLNSGGWIGYAGDVAPLLRMILEDRSKKTLNDQELMADIYMQGRYPQLELDHYSRIFQAMHSTDPPGLERCHPSDHVHETGGVYHNRLTNSTPAIFHFNGGGKKHHLSMEGKMWYRRPSSRDPRAMEELKASTLLRFGDQFATGFRAIPFGEVCPGTV